jgi:hypothetical protein
MTTAECQFEQDVLTAVLQSRWPERADGELRAHVAACAVCADVAAIAGAIEESRQELSVSAVIPDSGRVWWMAQRRARQEAVKAASRPLTTAQVAAVACVSGLAGAYFRDAAAWFQATMGRAFAGMGESGIAERFAGAPRLVAEHGALAFAMIAVLVVIPAAVYLAMGRD